LNLPRSGLQITQAGDECLHTSLVAVAQGYGHDCFHVNWLGLSGEADWDLMPRIVEEDFTFVTNSARDFRKLYVKEELHAGLVIIVPPVLPSLQRELFDLILQELAGTQGLVNEVIEVSIDGEEGATRGACALYCRLPCTSILVIEHLGEACGDKRVWGLVLNDDQDNISPSASIFSPRHFWSCGEVVYEADGEQTRGASTSACAPSA